MGNFGIYFDTHYYGEKRLQPSRRKRDKGKLVSSKRHFNSTWSYVQTRKQERGLNAEGYKVKLTDEQKVLKPLSPAQRMDYFGLPRDPHDAWKQCQENAAEKVTWRYYEFSPDPTLVEVLFELDRADLVRPLVVEGFYEGLRAYCAANYGAQAPPNMITAYHEKLDQYGRPQPHLHALSEATLVNGDFHRTELKLFKEQLADLREALDTGQGVFLDQHLPDIAWRDLYRQRHEEWELERERIEQERLGQEIEASLVAAEIIPLALDTPEPKHAEVILIDNSPDLSRPTDFPPIEMRVEESDWLPDLPVARDLDAEDYTVSSANEPSIDFDDF